MIKEQGASRLFANVSSRCSHATSRAPGWAARPRTLLLLDTIRRRLSQALRRPRLALPGRLVAVSGAYARRPFVAPICDAVAAAAGTQDQARGSTGIWTWRTSELAVHDETRHSATHLIQHATTGACPTSAIVSIPSHLPPEQLTASCSLALDVRIIVLPAPAPHSIDCNLSHPPSRTSHLGPTLLHRAPCSVRSCCTSHGTSPHRLPAP
ncbi:hypothetical protein PMIN01_03433 [Paraphaeosphaeria minitans]|uniref:Uncharacterized protein n=1 Tax=Paraphaeosphaeria minitans TaxID=565426 RepID=A0A9P6GND3_9PLEO|nr:hypothetical protein PMIN01_03433 [Paraphaeosphaeria minitans]